MKEKKEKKKSIYRDTDYYSRLIKEMVLHGPANAKELKTIIAKVEGDPTKNICDATLFMYIVNPFLKILPDNFLVNKEKSADNKGAWKNIYLLSGDLNEICSKVKTYMEDENSNKRVKSIEKIKTEKPEKVSLGDKKEKERKSKYNKGTYRIIIDILRNFCKYAGTIKVEDYRSFLIKKNISTRYKDINCINNFLKEVDYTYKIVETIARKEYLLEKCEEALLVLSKNYKDLYGEELDNSKFIMSGSIDKISGRSEIKIDDSRNRHWKWCIINAIGSIHRSNEESKSYVELESICKIIRLWKYECISSKIAVELLIEIDKQYPGCIDISPYKKSVRLINPDKLKELYHPKLKKEIVLVRCGLSLEKIKKYFKSYSEEIKIESAISEDDNIYSIVYDKSTSCMNDLVNLYRSFRGTDKILGNNELECKLDEIILAEKRRFEELLPLQNIIAFENY